MNKPMTYRSGPSYRAFHAGQRAGVSVATAARLHFGFLDPAATLGRSFGSLGLMIDGFATRLSLRRGTGPAGAIEVSHAPQVPAAEAQRALAHLRTLQKVTRITQPLALHIGQALPVHAGLGSGTQLALACGRAFAELHQIGADTRTLASWLGRGRRSAIGIAGFDQGGLLLDGGVAAASGDTRKMASGPLLMRRTLPLKWSILLALDPGHAGLTSTQEAAHMAALPPFPREMAADICHQVLMRVLIGIVEDEFEVFAEGLTHIQRLLGRHFAPAQGGVFTSPAVGTLIEWLGEKAGAGVGQSSWGPTGFAVFPTQGAAVTALDAARKAGILAPHLETRIVHPFNHGAAVDVTLP
ncbi:beta-ribofuranosylaminobenzene 5'-phosphate synthase family protein [Xanthobacter sp. TB0139]|uniref:beta-ribofuranosylaminobenzene 5'-phosphate synthase family protein n=1 Tax=Xanthobacter sp. TB0139 TaxID=3459178 RepID=UPI00403A4D33